MIFCFTRINATPSPVVYPPAAPTLEGGPLVAGVIHGPTALAQLGEAPARDVVFIEAERFHDARDLAYILLGTRSIHGTALEVPPAAAEHKGEFYVITWTGFAANNTLDCRWERKKTEPE